MLKPIVNHCFRLWQSKHQANCYALRQWAYHIAWVQQLTGKKVNMRNFGGFGPQSLEHTNRVLLTIISESLQWKNMVDFLVYHISAKKNRVSLNRFLTWSCFEKQPLYPLKFNRTSYGSGSEPDAPWFFGINIHLYTILVFTLPMWVSTVFSHKNWPPCLGYKKCYSPCLHRHTHHRNCIKSQCWISNIPFCHGGSLWKNG